MPHKVAAFLRREARERRRHALAHLVKGAGAGGPQQRLELGERLFDGIQIRTVGREESEVSADRFDGGAHGRLFVEREIVEHDDVAGPEGRHEHLFDIREEHGVIERPIEDRGGGQAFGRESRDHRVELPLATRRVVPKALAAGAATVAAQQIGGHAAFIEKHIPARVAERLSELPSPARGRDVRPALFVGVYRFF